MNPREGSLLGPTRLQNPENPALNLSLLALIRLQGRVEIFLKPAVSISRLHPSGGGIGILLVGRSSLSWESPVPKRGVNLCDSRTIGRNVPTVERPEMDAVFD